MHPEGLVERSEASNKKRKAGVALLKGSFGDTSKVTPTKCDNPPTGCFDVEFDTWR